MAKRTSPIPEPVPVNVVCSLCGEPWSLHQEENGEVSTLECIRLLKARRPTPTIIYRDRWPYTPTLPYWQFDTTTTTPTVGTYTINATNTPTIAKAVAA